METKNRQYALALTLVDCLFIFLVAQAMLVISSSYLSAISITQFLHAGITVQDSLFAGILTAVWLMLSWSLHRLDSDSIPIVQKFIPIVRNSLVISLSLGVYLEITRSVAPSVRLGLVFFVLAILYEIARTYVLGAIRIRIAAMDPEVVLIVGSGRLASKAWRELRVCYYSTVKLLGFVDDREIEEMAPDVADRYLGSSLDVPKILQENSVDRLIVAIPLRSGFSTAHTAIAAAEKAGVKISYLPDLYPAGARGRR